MISKFKQFKSRIKLLSDLKQKRREREFQNSEAYWESRYAKGGTSGAGSYGRLAHFKAQVLNKFVKEYSIQSVIEFGCGDGNQLSLAEYPTYFGLDVSPTAIQSCISRFEQDPTKRFAVYGAASRSDFQAELALSLDVVYHLVEDEVFNDYMRSLFGASGKFVIVYASNQDLPPDVHVRHRKFTDWVTEQAPDWALLRMIPNRYPFDPNSPDETSFAEFYIFERSL